VLGFAFEFPSLFVLLFGLLLPEETDLKENPFLVLYLLVCLVHLLEFDVKFSNHKILDVVKLLPLFLNFIFLVVSRSLDLFGRGHLRRHHRQITTVPLLLLFNKNRSHAISENHLLLIEESIETLIANIFRFNLFIYATHYLFLANCEGGKAGGLVAVDRIGFDDIRTSLAFALLCLNLLYDLRSRSIHS
jgi:hypothetical protein